MREARIESSFQDSDATLVRKEFGELVAFVVLNFSKLRNKFVLMLETENLLGKPQERRLELKFGE